jgi:hypothetical protein
MPLVVYQWDLELGGTSWDGDGTTWGYTIDGGLVAVVEQWRFGVGYRHSAFSEYDLEDDFSLDGETETVKVEDEFGGVYVLAGFGW